MKVLGIGNAIIDVICKVDDEYLKKNNLTKSTMKLVNEKEFKSLGLRDMHKMQVDALIEFIGITLNLATLTKDDQVIEETEALADELLKLFGANGIKLTIEEAD